MYSLFSSIVISGFSSNRIFHGYCSQFELNVSIGHGAVSNSDISSVLFCVISIFCDADK